MWAIVCRDWCEPDQLELDDVPVPVLTAGGVRIAVRAAGLNFADSLMIRGEYQVKPQLPFSPGLEISGDVLDVAPDVSRFQPGDRVMAVVPYGGFAEEVVARATDVFLIPELLDYVSAAGFPIAYGTSHVGLRDKLKLQAGETLLVHGAAGGVGLTAVEIAKKMGATVIATAGGADKLKIAKSYGADHLIDYKTEDIRARVKMLTAGRGVDAVYDPVGGDVFTASLRATVQGGRILVVGFASGTVAPVPANLLLVKNLSVIGFYWGAYRTLDPALLADSFEELLAWYAAGALKPHISHCFDLADAAKAMAMLQSRKATGKIVLKV
ncbi:MAG: NADPH:quinone oxidoreductase family protein [Rhodospirillales bacterium]|nr:NADPH:quinone oxidoreductase family protein [Rhodospirillales bacterium]